MDTELEQAILARLTELCDVALEDHFETSTPYTIGGKTGLYQLTSPYNTECEWTIIAATAIGGFNPTNNSPGEANVPATSGGVALVSGVGFFLSAIVTATGASNLTFTDGNGGNVVGEVLSTATVGQIIQMNSSFTTNLFANKSTTTPVVTASWSQPINTLPTSSQFVIGPNNAAQPTLSTTGTDAYGLQSATGKDSTNALPSFVGSLSPAYPMETYTVSFMPLPQPCQLYANIVAAGNAELLLTILFRRSLARYIPQKPRERPHAHYPVSRRANRTLLQGVIERGSEPGVPYEHIDVTGSPYRVQEVIKRK